MSDYFWIVVTIGLCGIGYLIGWTLGFQKGFNKGSGSGLGVEIDDLESILKSLKAAGASLKRLNKRDGVKINV